jgi:hypothetical protein
MYHCIHDYMYVALPTQLYVCSLSYYTLPNVMVVKMYSSPVVDGCSCASLSNQLIGIRLYCNLVAWYIGLKPEWFQVAISLQL